MDYCLVKSLCFELIKNIPIVIVALIAAAIAYRQYATAKAKLKLDLFEKRYEIFEAVWTTLSNPNGFAINDGTFTNLIPKATFLFGVEIQTYMNKIWKNRIEIWSLDRKYDAGAASQLDIERNAELLQWFASEAQEGVKEIFGKYLSFEDWH